MVRLAVRAARLQMATQTILVAPVQKMSRQRVAVLVLPLVLLLLEILPRPRLLVQQHRQEAVMAVMAEQAEQTGLRVLLQGEVAAGLEKMALVVLGPLEGFLSLTLLAILQVAVQVVRRLVL